MRQRRGWPGQRRPVGEPVRPPALATDQADLPQSGIRPRRSGSRQSLLLSGPGGTRSRSAARQSASCGEIPPRHRRLLRACCTRPGDRIAECDQQFPPSDGDCHTPLPCEVRKGRISRHECAVLTARHPARAGDQNILGQIRNREFGDRFFRQETSKEAPQFRQNKEFRRGNFSCRRSVLFGIKWDESVMPELPAHWLIREQTSSTPIAGSYQATPIISRAAVSRLVFVCVQPQGGTGARR